MVAIGTMLLLVGVAAAALVPGSAWRRRDTWERLASPGRLSVAHASLEKDCSACHTPVKGVDRLKCVSCHATNEALLQRQPTAFHADVADCRPCHVEHLGADQRLTRMDHAALGKIGLKQLREDRKEPGSRQAAERITAWIRQTPPSIPAGHPGVTAQEAVLECASCHAAKDRHQSLFGKDCVQCHGTATWRVPAFRHPAPASRVCAQCHQAPPSHRMMHFRMVSMRVARQEGARVDQCYRCHETTAWNDIQGVGWYKHH